MATPQRPQFRWVCVVLCPYCFLLTICTCVFLPHRHGNVYEPGLEVAPGCVSDHLSVVQLVDGRNCDGQLGHHRGNTGVDTARRLAPLRPHLQCERVQPVDARARGSVEHGRWERGATDPRWGCDVLSGVWVGPCGCDTGRHTVRPPDKYVSTPVSTSLCVLMLCVFLCACVRGTQVPPLPLFPR